MSENKTNVTQQQQMVRGAAWLTASNFISRLLGAFYIIPWYAWMGTHAEQANAPFWNGLQYLCGIPTYFNSRDSRGNS